MFVPFWLVIIAAGFFWGLIAALFDNERAGGGATPPYVRNWEVEAWERAEERAALVLKQKEYEETRRRRDARGRFTK